MTNVLVIAEYHNGILAPSTNATLSAALKIAPTADILLACEKDTLSNELARLEGVKKVWVLEHARFSHILAEDLAPVIVELAKNYTHILAGATTFGKNLLPRVAATLDVTQISDVSQIESEAVFVRPIYAGNAFEKVQSNEKIKVLTIRTTAFDKAKQGRQQAEISPLSYVLHPFEHVQFKKEEAPELTRPELTSAKVVVAGGRALKSAENFKLIEKLADKLGAAVGASRAAVDAGFVPNDFQVGQTGKIVAPDLYIAIGISGAIQHLAGMKDSKVIVAINKDSEAPIFQVADYGLVGDLFTLLPELEAALATKS
ncbi:MAG: electron transfer flavoprotein subunit alpha [Gammaproteobacteria bacterium 39-13]|nr:FAD-binding protein [Gammaproteobacteria bacterium]OJV95912.1 MAG: electron transfer flavoprotein subunit alpha [Gammaproteobacteria bacterium 39-13]